MNISNKKYNEVVRATDDVCTNLANPMINSNDNNLNIYCREVSNNILYNSDLLQVSEEDMAPAVICAEEALVTKYKAHVDQFVNMREHVKSLTKKSCKHNEADTLSSNRLYVQIANFAQNLDMPHFGSKQPDDIYYFSPFGIYLFGIVSPYLAKDSLFCQYFTELEFPILLRAERPDEVIGTTKNLESQFAEF